MTAWDAAEAKRLVDQARTYATDSWADALQRRIAAIASQLDGAGVEIERLKVEAIKAQPIWSHAEALAQRDALIHQSVALTGQVRTLTAERDTLRQQLEAAQAERETMKSERNDALDERDDMRAARDRAGADLATVRQLLATSEHIVMRLRQHDERQAARIASIDGELEAKTSELAFADRTISAAARRIAQAHAELASVREVAAAAQQRIAELEAEETAVIEHRERLEGQINQIADALGDESEWSNCCDRGENAIELAGSIVMERDSLTAALRAIAPVYRAADPSKRMEFKLYDAVITARAALTPELLAVIEGAGR